MKNSLFAVLLGVSALASTAHADVSWRHTGRVTVGGTPVVNFDFRNQWSGDRHRATLSVDAAKGAATFGMPTGNASKAEVSIIERLNDDRLLLVFPDIKANTTTTSFVDEPYSTLRKRLRFDFFEGAADKELSTELPPELTPAQRQRLGRELRAVLEPFSRKTSRQYFRALPQIRTINGVKSRGYRYTSAFNTATFTRAAGMTGKGQDTWMRATAEWWLAEEQPGDSEIRAFTTRANNLKTEGGPATVSMWLNEYLPVLWEASPREAHAALASLVGEMGTPGFGFRGTPVQFFATITPPPVQAFAVGDVRFALELKNNHQTPIDEAVFQAPAGAKRQPIEPFLQMTRNAIRQNRAKMEGLMDNAMGMSNPAQAAATLSY